MRTAYIVDILRTPIGKFGGSLASVRPDDLAALVIKKLLERNKAVDAGFDRRCCFWCGESIGGR